MRFSSALGYNELLLTKDEANEAAKQVDDRGDEARSSCEESLEGGVEGREDGFDDVEKGGDEVFEGGNYGGHLV